MDSDIKPGKRSKKIDETALNTNSPAETKFSGPQEVFRTPEEVVADQTLPTGEPAHQIHGATTEDRIKIKKDWRQKLKFSWPPNNKEWLATAIIIVVGGIGIFVVLSHHGAKPVANAQPKTVKAAPKPTTVPSMLTGLPVDPGANKRPVTGVMVENSPDARPQAGLSQAGVVFEAIAEGGITRFLALYQETTPDNVGPVRSARPYYEQWALGFDAGYAHVGGSPEALADIKAWGVRDLDQFYNAGAFRRITERVAPHNVYTSIPTLIQFEAGKGFNDSKFTSLVRKPKENPAKQVTAKSIDFKLSGPLYNVHYDYIAETNSYHRSEAGAPHIDANTNAQLSPKVVIAMVMPYSLEADGYHSDYTTIGSGPVYVYQDGTVTTGTWTKTSATSQFIFTDAAKKPIKLNPGQTWLTAVSSQAAVSSAP